MRIERVLNTNALVVSDDGKRAVVMGKGIGYGRRKGDDVDRARISETFVPDSSHSLDRLTAFLTELPMEYVRLAHDIAKLAEEEIGVPVSQSLVLPLADHLHFAVQRQNENLELSYPLRWEVRQLYPREVSVGERGVELVHERLGVELPRDEAVSLALHLVNAAFDGEGLDRTVGMTERISRILGIVESGLGVHLSPDDMSVARFVTHLRYLFVRLDKGGTAPPLGGELLPSLAESHPQALGIARRIALVLAMDDNGPSDDELLYLTLHVARLSQAVHTSP